jgi:hypothetical protein
MMLIFKLFSGACRSLICVANRVQRMLLVGKGNSVIASKTELFPDD